MFKPLLSGALMLACTLTGAHAEWSYKAVDRGPGKPQTHLAVTSAQYHGLGLRCDGAALTLQYLTNDPMSDEQMARANTAGIALTVGLQTQAFRLAGELQRVPQGVLVVARAEPALLRALSSGTGEIALAIAAGSRLTHQRAFSLEGASGPLKQLGAHCAA